MADVYKRLEEVVEENCFLKEENKKLKEERDIESKWHCQAMRELWKVENENKCLKRDMKQYKEEKGKEILELKHFIFDLEEENKKLKEKYEWLQKNVSDWTW